MKKHGPQCDCNVCQSTRLYGELCQHLIGKEPEIVGATIVQLVSQFLAGFHPDLRDMSLTLLLRHVHEMVPLAVAELIEEGTVPPEWADPPKTDAPAPR